MRERTNEPLSVSGLSLLIKSRLENDPGLRSLSVRGEISNFKVYQSGHCYFSLKDEESVISCVMWASYAAYLSFVPKDGDEVLVHGRISVYPARGSYQLAIDHMELFGQGAELLRLKLLAEKLAKEGLFDESRKRPLPRFPHRVGVIAGKGSAGLRDIVVNLSARWPIAELVVEPSLVQGKEAPKAIMAAFSKLQKQGIDVLIIARGGGSSEDLSAFNDEDLVRLVATSVCPVISAVGHEVDTTLIDLVADRRVSTPTAAAIASVPDKYEVYQTLDLSRDRLQGALEGLLRRLRERLDSLSKRSFFLAPESIYRQKREDLIQMSHRLDLAIAGQLQRKKDRLETSKRTLESLNPDRVLSRGFSLSIDSKGKPLTSAASVKEGESIKTRFKDGIINSIVTSKETDHGR